MMICNLIVPPWYGQCVGGANEGVIQIVPLWYRRSGTASTCAKSN